MTSPSLPPPTPRGVPCPTPGRRFLSYPTVPRELAWDLCGAGAGSCTHSPRSGLAQVGTVVPAERHTTGGEMTSNARWRVAALALNAALWVVIVAAVKAIA